MKKIIMQDDGVIFYAENGVCIDINLDNQTDTMVFSPCDDSIKNIDLLSVDKTFPNIKKLIIMDGIENIFISNHMFPNVRSVKSLNPKYLSGCTLKGYDDRARICLLNSFCLSKDETLDIAYVEKICNFALDGCQTRNLSNTEYPIRICENQAFEGSAFHVQPEDNGICMCGNIVADVDYQMDDIVLPRKAFLLENIIDVSKIKKLTFTSIHDFSHASVERMPSHVCIMDINASVSQLSRAADRDGISDFYVHPNHPDCTTKDGVLFSKDMTKIIKCPPQKTGPYIVPDGVNEIMNFAFHGCANITSLVLPDSVTILETACFQRCTGLKSIKFGNKITKIGLGHSIFANCCALEEVTIPKQVREIGEGCFKFCDNLRNVYFEKGSQLRALNKLAFYRCPLNYIELPESIYYIEDVSLAGTKEVKIQRRNWRQIVKAVTTYANSNETIRDFNYCKVWINGEKNPFIIPQVMKYNREAQTFRHWYLDEQPLQQAYRYANTPLLRVELAFVVYNLTKDDDAKKYLKKYGKTFALRMIEIGENQKLKEVLELNILTKATIQAAIEKAAAVNNSIAQAYLLQMQQTEKKRTFVL